MQKTPIWQEWTAPLDTLWQRVQNRHLTIAVTGLSQSGKTAFITALIDQLQRAGVSARLPAWEALQEGRILGVQRGIPPHHHIPVFDVDGAMRALQQEPPQWPVSTTHLSEIRLELRYRSQQLLRRKIGQNLCRLYLDIVDYPGEWLLDLPLLQWDYATWSQQMQLQLRDPLRQRYAQAWVPQVTRWQADQAAQNCMSAVQQASAAFADYLLQLKQQEGLHYIQPGRFVLPGEYAGAPLLQFVPWLADIPTQKTGPHSLYHLLEDRYNAYKTHIVEPFYRDYFRRVDRQIVLVDCLQPFRFSATAMSDLHMSMAQILSCFRYGQSHYWQKLLAPKIDRLLFVASKIDQVTPEQHPAVLQLLQELVHSGMAKARFDGVMPHCMAAAALCATDYRQVVYQGRTMSVVHGYDAAGQERAIFPGTVPSHIPDARNWDSLALQLNVWAAPHPHEPRRHIRLDQIIQTVLGDKLL